MDRFDLDRLPLLMAYLNPQIFTREEVAAAPPIASSVLADADKSALPLDGVAQQSSGSIGAGSTVTEAVASPTVDESRPPMIAIEPSIASGSIALASSNSYSSLELNCLSAKARTALGIAGGAASNTSDAGFTPPEAAIAGVDGQLKVDDVTAKLKADAVVYTAPCRDAPVTSDDRSGGSTAVIAPVVVLAVPQAVDETVRSPTTKTDSSTPVSAPLARTVHTIYIGVMPDKERLKTEKLSLTPSLQAFKVCIQWFTLYCASDGLNDGVCVCVCVCVIDAWPLFSSA